MMSVSIILPAKDEEEAIVDTLDALPLATLKAMGLETDVVVIDGSTDRTARLARAWGAQVIRDDGAGKGRAVRHARARIQGELIVMIDADGTYAADAIPRLLGPLLAGDADVVMGRRTPQDGSMTALHRFGNRVLSAQASVLYARRCGDLCTGLWAFRKEALRRLPLRSRGFELEAEMFALSCRMALRLAVVPVDYLPRTGEAKLSALRDGSRIFASLLRCRFQSLGDQVPTRIARPKVAAVTDDQEDRP